MKTIDKTQTLKYKITLGDISKGSMIILGNNTYRYIETVTDWIAVNSYNTLVVVQNISNHKMEVLNVSDPKIGDKEATIL